MAKETPDGQEKTEQPSERKLSKAREEGNSPKSMEVNSLAIFFFGIIIIFLLRGYIGKSLADLTVFIFGSLDKLTMNVNMLQYYAIGGALFYLKVLAPFMIVLVVVALAVGFGQVGIRLSPKALMPKFSKLNPISGIKNKFFSKEPLVETIKNILKVAIIGLVSYWLLASVVLDAVNLIQFSVFDILDYMSRNSISFIWKVGLIYAVLAAMDFVYQKYKFKEDMKMTKKEVKDEYKDTEGDPTVKSRIKSKQMEMAMKRMMAEVPKADVVITNPTHYAVALKYEPEKSGAPVVVAKGADRVAQRIKEIARENDVPLHEDVFLARALYASCDIGDEIPEKLYKVVAEVLAYVYRMKQKVKKTII